MARVLADKNLYLAFAAAWVAETDYQILDSDSAEVKVSSAAAATTLHDNISIRDFVLGATGEDTINDPPIANIGSSENTPGATSYDGCQFRWFRLTGTGTPWHTYVKGTTGHIIKRIGISVATAPANSQECALYQVIFGAQRDVVETGGYYTYLQAVGIQAAYEHSTIVTALA